MMISSITDIDTLLQWRREVIQAVFGMTPDASLIEANRAYYEKHVTDGTHLAVVYSADGKDKGCGAICFTDELPSPDNPSGRCAYIMNIYVREAYRNHGVAHAIVRYLLEEAIRRGCGKIYLETTAAGRSLYSSIGFTPMPDLMHFSRK